MAQPRIRLNTTFGDSELCAWQPGRGITWVQTRNPRHARRLAQRRDRQLTAVGVSGGYLRTFEFQRPIRWAIRLMRRYRWSARRGGHTSSSTRRRLMPHEFAPFDRRRVFAARPGPQPPS